MTISWYALAFLASMTIGGVNSLELVGNNGSPTDTFPLGLCQGDCDNDIQCFGYLTCFMRTGFQSVPGCSGTGEYDKDYCYNPQKPNALTFLASKQKNSEMYPLGECQGECHADTDCAGTLECFQRSNAQSVPGCTGTGVVGKSYCCSLNAGTVSHSQPANSPQSNLYPSWPSHCCQSGSPPLSRSGRSHYCEQRPTCQI
jgi:hypothetical protein